jgi:hypothetical protein
VGFFFYICLINNQLKIKIMSRPKFYQAVAFEVEGNVLDHVYPHLKGTPNQMTLTERMGSEDAKCEDCKGNEWLLMAKESPAVIVGGKAYMECLGCGNTTHL